MARFFPVLAVFSCAALVASSSSASGNTYTGCLNPGGNILHVAVGPQPGHPCSSNQLQISWNQAGPMGPQGPQGPAGPAGPMGPAGPAGGGALGFYQRSVQFVCPGSAGDPNCPMPNPPLVASCDAGDVATGGGAIREGATFPIQDMPSYPVPRNVATAPTGWSTTTWTIGAGDTVTLMVVCADLP